MFKQFKTNSILTGMTVQSTLTCKPGKQTSLVGTTRRTSRQKATNNGAATIIYTTPTDHDTTTIQPSDTNFLIFLCVNIIGIVLIMLVIAIVALCLQKRLKHNSANVDDQNVAAMPLTEIPSGEYLSTLTRREGLNGNYLLAFATGEGQVRESTKTEDQLGGYAIPFPRRTHELEHFQPLIKRTPTTKSNPYEEVV
jgi:hypothetical protein